MQPNALPMLPGAEPYARLRATLASRVAATSRPTERQLQALWQDASLRPTALALPDGTPIEVLNAGRWNAAPGPDFQDALITLGGIPRRGDIELHLTPADWDAHRHAGDPAYAKLILHVTWHPGPAAKTLPPALPTLILQPFAEPNGTPFDFSRLDLSCAPYPPPAPGAGHPCLTHFAHNPAARERLIAAAGLYRLQAKARAIAESLRAEGPEQGLYGGILRAMGYGQNTEPFCRLAKELPLARIAPFPPLQRFAILAGIAGLLTPQKRQLWDLCWQSGLPPPLHPYQWNLRALRPQNHPLLRLAGAVGLLQHLPLLTEAPLDHLPKAIEEASRTLCPALNEKRTPIGPGRANAILANLAIPLRIALGTLPPDALANLPGETPSMPMRDAWHRLAGSLRKLPKDALRQQGLLQISHDFCHNPHLTCAQCPIGTPAANA